MRVPVSLATVLALAGVGLAVGLLIAPAISAVRPPRVERTRVTVPSAEVLDSGAQCGYTWGGAMHVWEKPDPDVVCPSLVEAQRFWRDAAEAVAAFQAAIDAVEQQRKSVEDGLAVWVAGGP